MISKSTIKIILPAIFLVAIFLMLLPMLSLADSVQVNIDVTDSGGGDTGGGSGGGGGGGGGNPPPPGDVSGCTNPAASNYNSSATVDDGSCIIPGCTDPLANNYNSSATTNNGTCTYNEQVPNVTDFTAILDVEGGQVELYWNKPSFVNFQAVRIVRKINSIPTGPTDGSLIYDGTSEFYADNSLPQAGTYFYVAFVRSTTGNYSSGALTAVSVSEEEVNEIPPPPPPTDEELPPPPDDEVPDDSNDDPLSSDGDGNSGGGDNIDPFESFPEATDTHPLIRRLSVGDFVFSQIGSGVQYFGNDSVIRITGRKEFTIALAYNKVPEVLKTIGVTIFDPDNNNKALSFLLRLNEAGTYYEATVSPLPRNGVYPITIHILNYSDQTTKKIKGFVEVRDALAPSQNVAGAVVEKIVSPLAVGSGIAVGVTQTVFLTSGATSVADIYLIFVKGFGALLGFLGIRRKHKPWGTVYDSVTKRPIDPAYVTVHPLGEIDKEAASAITDIDGRYGFFLPAGTYTIKAGKTHYAFPSQKLAGKESDELYSNLYFGEPVETHGEEVVDKNIPLDPIGFDWNEFAKTKTDFFKVFSQKEAKRARIMGAVYTVGLLMALGTMIYDPRILNLSMLLVYGLIYLIQILWHNRHKVVNIRWKGSGEPIAFAIVRLFISDLDQEVKHVVTDQLGRFYVLVRPGTYYFTVEEKQSDGSYLKVYQSKPVELKKGILTDDIEIEGRAPTSPIDQGYSTRPATA